MKLKPVRLIPVVIAFIALVVTHIFTLMSEKQSSRDYSEFIFTLPIPEDVCSRFQVKPNPEIIQVYIAGEFSGWISDNPAYRMLPRTNQTGGVSWHIRLDLRPGRNQYKYVATIKGRQDPVWIHDTSHNKKVPDGFDGYNSLRVIPDTAEQWRLSRNISLTVLIISLIAFLLPLWKDRVNIDTSLLTHSLLIAAILIISQLFLTFQLRRSTKERSILQAETIAGFLETEEKEMSLLSYPEINPRISGISHTFLLDTNLGLLAHTGGDHPDLKQLAGNRDFPEWIQTVFFHRRQDVRNTPFYGTLTAVPARKDLSGYQVITHPVREDHRITAYIAFLVDSSQLNNRLNTARWFMTTLALITLIILFAGKLLLKRGKQSVSGSFYEQYSITERERDIIALIIQGANNQDIARKLFISEKTVKSHVYNIYQKAGIQNRVELINKINSWKDEA